MNPCPHWASRGFPSFLLAATVILAMAQSACQDSDPRNRNASSQSLAESARGTKARLRVQVDTVRRVQMASSARVTGTVRAFHHAKINAETQGRVIARHVEAGASVPEGELLIELESSRLRLELRRTEASLRAARTVLAHAERDYDRAQQLLAQKAMSIQRYDDLEHAVNRAKDDIALAKVARDTAKRNLKDARITAPFSGTVDAVMVDVGDFVTPGTAVATLVDLTRVRIFAGVTAREAARLEAGSPARVSFADLGGVSFDASLESVGRVASGSDGTYDIELWMEPVGSLMRDGLVAQIELTDSNETPRLMARRAAVLRRDGHPEVFVVVEEGGDFVARARPLRTGRSDGEWIEILAGLEEGDRVVWDGHFALDDGSSVIVDGGSALGVASNAENGAENNVQDNAQNNAQNIDVNSAESDATDDIATRVASESANPDAAGDTGHTDHVAVEMLE